MRIVFFFFILLLLIIFINKKREYFSEKIVGDIAYTNYEVDDKKIAKLFSDNFLSPKLLNYSIGEAGVGISNEVNTISFEPKNIKAVVPEAIKSLGDKEITDMEAVVPILFEGVRKNFKNINSLLVDIEQVKADIIDVTKYDLEKMSATIDELKKK